MEPFEYRGVWWHPAFPKLQFSGILSFDPKSGATLEIIGDNFKSRLYEEAAKRNAKRKKPIHIESSSDSSSTMFNILHGYTNKGGKVTLWQAVEASFSFATGYRGSRLSVGIVITGFHFQHEKDISLQSIAIYYTHLEKWLGDSSFYSELSPDRSTMKILYSHPKPIEVSIEDLKIRLSSHLQHDTNEENYFQAKRIAFIDILSAKHQHLTTLLEGPIRLLRDFLLLGIGRTLLPIQIIGKTNKSSGEDADPISVHIFFRPEGAHVPESKKLTKFDMWFRYDDISDNFPQYLDRWFTISDELKPVFDLYFGLFYIPAIRINMEFLTLTQALEVYCDRMIKGEKFDTFEDRFNFLFEHHLHNYREIVGRAVPNTKEFVGRLTQTRHYLTHYSKEREKKAAREYPQLRRLIETMNLLLRLCLFRELGLSQDLVTNLAKKSLSFRRSYY